MHALSILLAGETRVFIGDKTVTRYPGAISLVRKNTLLKVVKIPESDRKPHETISIFFPDAMLKYIGTQENLVADAPYSGEPGIDFSNNVFIKGYFDSLAPYIKTEVRLTPAMAELKTREALQLILRQNRSLVNFLFDFSEPFKIDLEAFMNKNYIYRIPISEFARLTGRSLATFKRDFQKLFSASPERWIQKKRLEHAHFLLSEKNQSPSSVFTEVGFESLSHFSAAFKKHFGYNPSTLA
jgi:AraC-like DNA-binding protein